MTEKVQLTKAESAALAAYGWYWCTKNNQPDPNTPEGLLWAQLDGIYGEKAKNA